jgi:transcriptional regulator
MPGHTEDLRHGSLDLLVLKAVAWQPMHGYSIAKWIQDRAGADFPIVDAALYKALHRLEEDGALRAEWGVSENNRRAKYYSLTARGRQVLKSEVAGWRRYAAAINAVIEAPEGAR